MGSNLKLRSPAGLTAIGVAATLLLALGVVLTLLLTGGAKAVSDNAALIGALIALGGVFTTQLVNTALEDQRVEEARRTALAQRERELEIAQRRAEDEALQTYLDQISTLLLDERRPLQQAQPGHEVRTVARAHTLTTLNRLDGSRKGSVLQFLYESDLITKDRMVVQLTGADLRGADLRGAYLPAAHLSNADLRGADLSNADLRGANLRGANLNWADLSGANLSNTNLSGARWLTEDQLGAAKSLKGATMPNGQKYEVWLNDKQSSGGD
jgi:hypothetical protein